MLIKTTLYVRTALIHCIFVRQIVDFFTTFCSKFVTSDDILHEVRCKTFLVNEKKFSSKAVAYSRIIWQYIKSTSNDPAALELKFSYHQ